MFVTHYGLDRRAADLSQARLQEMAAERLARLAQEYPHTRFEWQPAEKEGAIAWWRVERDEFGRQRSVRVRAVDRNDHSPEVPRDLRDPRRCEDCQRDLAHTGAWHRQYAPFRPSLLAAFLHRGGLDPLRAG